HLCDRAELATQRATAAGLDGLAESGGLPEEVLARHGQVFEVDELVGAINRLEPAGHEIGHYPIPEHFGLVDHDRIEVFGAFVRHKGRVTAAADGPNSPFAEVVGQVVAALGLAGHHGDPYQVRRLVEVKRFEFLLDDLDLLEVGRGKRRDHGQVEVMD